jgi:hypothetical protein
MTAVTFGELARQVEERLSAALACQPGLADPVAVARELHRAVGRMTRYLDDRAPGYAIENLSTVDMPPWQRAAVDARTALRWAASSLHEAAGNASGPKQDPGDVMAGCLAEATTSMMAGRDLLHTHQTAAPDGWPSERSAWAAAVTSAPVTRALTTQIARWSGQVAMVASRQAATCTSSQRQPAGLADGLQAAAQWLWLAQAAIRPAQAVEPVTDGDHRLLAAIPLARNLRRVPPEGAEQADALCAGITVSAERLCTAVLVAAERTRWAPVSADAWRWSATAAAVTGQAGEHLLRTLASQPGVLPEHTERLQRAVGTLHQATQAWRQAAAQWLDLATEMRGLASPVVTEIGDLVLRMGRLAWDDPHWTPARHHPVPARTAASLAAADAREIVAAVHQAADALAQVAAADAAAVTARDHAGRLYVPTRTLPDSYNVPRRYATAPVQRAWPLLDAYTTAAQASARAAAVLADLALAVDVPSSSLALARAACAAYQPSASSASQSAAAAVADRLPTQTATSGPLEQAIQQLRLDDPALLLRAAAIDQAARHLFAQAERASAQSVPRTADTAAQQRPGDAARLAAKDCPAGVAIKPANSARGNQTVARPPTGAGARPPRRPSSRSRPQSKRAR